MIYVTGDLHGEIDISKLNTKNFPQQKNLTKDDYVIILGDFGLLWNDSKQEHYWRKWLDEKPWTTLFVDGNHESFDLLDNFPIEIWNGGKIHRINDSIIHLMRGQIFEIDGKKFFTFGGANSHDRGHRKEGKTWWSREMPSKEEMQEGINNLFDNDFKVDYVLSHTCPSDITPYIGYSYGNDSLERFFNHIMYRLEEHDVDFKWFFGHYHKNICIKDKFQCLYRDIIKL